jgi:hypothetical protein
MLQRLRVRFGIPGVISVIALVFAMFGGAYAASNPDGGSKATDSAKAKKGPRGPKGAKGDTGPAGPVGPAGPAGAKGDAGAAGANGANGESVVNTAVPTSSTTCNKLGGAEFKVGNGAPTTACNGAKGAPGAPGAPGPTCDEVTGECLLPEGATETGQWAASGGKETFQVVASISFPLRSSSEPAETHYVTVNEQNDVTPAPAECPGTAELPEAIAGSEPALCLYEGTLTNLEVSSLGFTGFTPNRSIGVTMRFTMVDQSLKSAVTTGTWALTAPVSP